MKDNDISFHEEDLVGKLINILGNDQLTAELIRVLSALLTGKERLETSERDLIKVFQGMRSELIRLYTEQILDEF